MTPDGRLGERSREAPSGDCAGIVRPIPVRTVSWLMMLLTAGAALLIFTHLTVHGRGDEELRANSMALRTHFSIVYWLEHGYLRAGGLALRTSSTTPLYFHRSSTGGRLLSGFLVQKVHSAVTGRYNWHLQALHNQVVSLFTAVVLGLLGFRLARRCGLSPLHAFILGLSLEAVHFTFPDNLALYWGTTGRESWLFFAAVFLLIEERCIDGRTRALTFAQGVSAFCLTYVEYLAGIAFIASYAVVTLVAGGERSPLMRLARVGVLPVLLALGVFGGQLWFVHVNHPEIPKLGSDILERSGLDGSSQYYVDHRDIADRRDLARANFPHNRPHLFRWPWVFFAGAAALVAVLIAGICGRVPRVTVIALVSLLGAYVLYAALFSQAVVIHPYIYDVLLFTPLALALFIVAPSLIESATGHRGVVVVAVFFVAIWVSMVQMRHYALRYPLTPKISAVGQPVATRLPTVGAAQAEAWANGPQLAREAMQSVPMP